MVMTTTPLLEDKSSRGVFTLTLSRPDKSNALDRATLERLAAALTRAEQDRAIRLVVLRGAGKHFCSGGDVSGGISQNHAAAEASISRVCVQLNSLPKPAIAVVHGACIGGGVALAACCDTVLATPDAFFAIPETRLGFPPAELMPFFLTACGARFLRRHLLAGSRFTSVEALQGGLVHGLHETGAIDAILAETVEAYLHAAPGAVAAAKNLLERFGHEAVPAEELHSLHNAFAVSAEAREGLASFKEKRRPHWYPPGEA
jgi:methylglutaconyl-CoA hydratase